MKDLFAVCDFVSFIMFWYFKYLLIDFGYINCNTSNSKTLAAKLKRLFASVDLKAYIEELVNYVLREIHTDTDFIRKVIQGLDIVSKININSKMRKCSSSLKN